MYWKVLGWSDKGNISFICLASNEASVKRQFEIAAKQAGYGPVFWDQPTDSIEFEPKVSLLRIYPSDEKTLPPIHDWSQHDFVLSISRFKLNTVEEYP